MRFSDIIYRLSTGAAPAVTVVTGTGAADGGATVSLQVIYCFSIFT